jgi:ribosomal protein S18 acetylase RimI-like enzyme
MVFSALARSTATSRPLVMPIVDGGWLNWPVRNGGMSSQGRESHGDKREFSAALDAEILHYAMREAVRTSPGSFVKTVEDVDAESLDYWINEIRSSTWAVAQRGGEVVGVVASKRPDPDKDREDPATVRYIESVWVAPGLRRKQLGERLIKYLLVAEYWNNQYIKQFVLWVFATNTSAMRLYEHIGFVRTPERNVGIRTEIKYRLDFNPEVHTTIGLVMNDSAHRQDHLYHGVTYRVLGQLDSP